LALKFTARFSDQILLTVEDSMHYFDQQSKLMVTGYPTRFNQDVFTISEANNLFNLQQDLPTLLVFGGSKGARSINRVLIDILPNLLTEMQVIHVSGQVDWPEIEAAKKDLPMSITERYHAFPYLYNRMGAAMKAADLVVSRAGASILGEFPVFSLPAILIPYPHAWRYQEVNAYYLEKRGAALVLQDHELKVHLLSTIIQLMSDQQTRSEMSRAMSSLASPQAAESIADILRGLVALPSLERI
jgi:UDP-N-acetylglucosamine--N-acetylmuramyl-(pentapeptide) pyrophosphoryl-undecaprenol N-acetylglucosamine transferase